MVVVGELVGRERVRLLQVADWGFALGSVLFSGSLYLLILAGWPVGLVTPLGGLLLMAGWGALVAYGCRRCGP